MKPAWDRLMKDFKDSKTALVADVDCTAEGKPLCDSNGVKGFPTIKYGDPNNLEAYEGGRDYDSLKEFADENLGPSCGPANLDLCDDEKKAKIAEYTALGAEALGKKVDELEKQISDAESTFESELKKLQNKYQDLQKEKEDAIAEAKGAGLGMMKSVRAHLEAGGGAAEDKDEL